MTEFGSKPVLTDIEFKIEVIQLLAEHTGKIGNVVESTARIEKKMDTYNGIKENVKELILYVWGLTLITHYATILNNQYEAKSRPTN